MPDRTDFVGGAAVVEAGLIHDERGSRLVDLSVRAVEPLDFWGWVAVRLTDKLFGITPEHRDCAWKFCGINDGLCCGEKMEWRSKRLTYVLHSNIQRLSSFKENKQALCHKVSIIFYLSSKIKMRSHSRR